MADMGSSSEAVAAPRLLGFWERLGFGIISDKDESLAKKVTLAFGFMGFVPLLLVLWSLSLIVLPNLTDGGDQSYLYLFLIGIIISIFTGYSIRKRTVRGVMHVVEDARIIARERLGGPIAANSKEDEIGELARTFQRINRELEQKVSELQASRELVKSFLSRVTTAIASHNSIDHLLELIVEQSVQALNAHMGSLLLIDETNQQLVVKTAWSWNGRRCVSTQRMKLGEGIAGWVAKEGSAMMGTASPSSLGISVDEIREGAALCVPLKVRGKSIGVISVLRKEVKPQLTEDDQTLLASIGSQIAVAIDQYQRNIPPADPAAGAAPVAS